MRPLAEIATSGLPSIMAAPTLLRLAAQASSVAAMLSTAEPMTAVAVTIADLTIVAEATTETARQTLVYPIVGTETLITALATPRIAQTKAAKIMVATSVVRPHRAILTIRPPILGWSKNTKETSIKCSVSRTPSAKKCSGEMTRSNKD